MLGAFQGREEPDGAYPEDWVGSVTTASNPGRDEPEAGLSRLADGVLLRDAIGGDPEHWLGAAHLERFGPTPGLLVKLLDAAQRLPVHAHPGRAFAQAHLGSPFGKTEAWIVLATRAEEAEVWVGLREETPPAQYLDWVGRQDTAALLGSLNRVSVRAGDVVFVPAGIPHAIGGGALIVELQEPTDFSLVSEWRGFPIRPEDSTLGLGWGVAVGALDLAPHQPVLKLPPEARGFFWADEIPEPAGRFAVMIVLDGEGTIDGAPARRGDCFVLPARADRLEVAGGLRVLRCLAPDPG